MIEISREEAWRRWRSAKKTKRDMVDRMVKELTEDFVLKYGKKPESIEVW